MTIPTHFLSSEERHELKSILHRSGHSAQEHGRANAILLLDDGVPAPLVAKLLFLDEQTIRNFFDRYYADKLAGLLKDKRCGKKSKLSDSEKESLRQYLDTHLYTDSTLITAYILMEFGVSYSKSGTKKLLHELGFVYKKTKHLPGNCDPEKQMEFAACIQTLLREKSPDSRVYFMDGTHPRYNSFPGHGWILKGKDKELPANTGRLGLNLNGAIDIETHQAIVFDVPTIDAASVVDLLRRIEEANPEAESIYVFADNARYNHARIVKEFLATSRICLVYLPPYSPNLNLIERLWKLFKKEVINNRYYPTYQEFKEECLLFFNNLSEYSDKLKTLLTPNFQLFTKSRENTITRAY